MKTIYPAYLLLFLCLLSFSCKKWVEVKPTDRLNEDQLFLSKEGFIKALNGVYVEMAHPDLYGKELSAGAIDVMGQYYFIKNSQHTYLSYATFKYTEDQVKSTFDKTWRKAYELIANCNVIIEKCGNAPSQVLPEPYYGIVKGEALALRAMLHLDMLRLFGPIYNEANKSLPAIPYVNKTGYEIFPISGSEAVLLTLTEDLKAALSLMENTDPIRTEGVKNGSNPSGRNDLYYRQYRLNYYAAKALLARAYMWENNKPAALLQAESLLNEVQTGGKNIFPYVTFAAATDGQKPDRMFSTEVMFSMYNIKREGMYDELFNVSLNAEKKLSFSDANEDETRLNDVYDDRNDYRRRIWQKVSAGTVTAVTNLKYVDIADAPGRYMIPLIRISEILLIAAESHPDLTVATEYFNKLRTARNCVSKFPGNATELKNEITKEFRREMIGEGQQFFYYKRNGMQSIPDHAVITGSKTMVLNDYKVPLPESETSQRN